MRLNGWQLVTIVIAGLGAFSALAIFGKDTGALIAGALAILGAFGYTAREVSSAKQDLAAVKTQTNGNNSELVSLLRSSLANQHGLAEMLATMQPTQATEDLRPISPAR